MLSFDLYKELSGERGPFALDLSFDIEAGSFVPLLGPSGSGKTTLLRALAGLGVEELRGRVSFGNEVWFDSDSRRTLSPTERGVTCVMQGWSLFPHWTLEENVLCCLSKREHTDSGRGRELNRILDRFGILSLKHRYPHQVSGGQRMRAALAQMLFPQPRLLLIDEGLSSLDPPNRRNLLDEVMALQADRGFTCVMATHLWDDESIAAMPCLYLEYGKAQLRRLHRPHLRVERWA